MTDNEALADLGRFMRAQREIAQLSIRSLARLTNVSDSYLSQVERGLYQPSPDVLRAVAEGLGLAPDVFFRRMGWLSSEADPSSDVGVIEAIRADDRLTEPGKSALIQMYRTLADGS